MADPREKRDRDRLRKALEGATSTRHVLVQDMNRRTENEQQSRVRRASVPKPSGRKMNDHNTPAKKAAQPNIGKKTSEAFGIPPIQLL